MSSQYYKVTAYASVPQRHEVEVTLPLAGPQGPTGPQGPAGASTGDVLTQQGDLLYRGASAAARLGIGTAGQILKVNAGATAPEWGAPPASGVTSVAGRTGDVTLAKADVGLGNVDNTSDANKPVSTATQTALDGKASSSHTHTASQVTDFNAAAAGAAPVQSVAGRTGAVTLAVADVSGAAASSNSQLSGLVTISGSSVGQSGTLQIGATTGSFTRDVELNSTGIVFRNSGSVGTTTIARGSGGSSNYTLTPPLKTGTLAVIEDFASPPSIGSTTPAAGSFTNLTASAELQLPTNAPVSASAGDLYRVTDTLRYRDSTNTERLLLNATDNLANLASAATARTNLGLGSSSAVTFASLTATPAANTTALTSTGYSLTGSNAQSLVDLAGTWNTTGTPTALKLNVTNTASNSASLLMDLQTGGTSQFSVRRDGRITLPVVGGGIMVGGSLIDAVGSTTVGLRACQLGWDNNAIGIANQTFILGDAANVISQRNGTAAQEYRLHGTYTSSTNYQRMAVKSVRQTLSTLSGASATTTGTFIPDGAVVVGVTTRVGTALTGATGYTIGDGTDADRWGDITGTAVGTTSDNRDWTAGTVECFTAGGNITLTAKTSNFTAGAIEICVFYLAGEAD